jgi:hypothetical protein
VPLSAHRARWKRSAELAPEKAMAAGSEASAATAAALRPHVSMGSATGHPPPQLCWEKAAEGRAAASAAPSAHAGCAGVLSASAHRLASAWHAAAAAPSPGAHPTQPTAAGR